MKPLMLGPPILAFVLMVIAPAAHAQARIVPNPKSADADATQVAPSSEVTAPVWLDLPTAHDFAVNTPERARKQEKSGSAVMRCFIRQDGGLENCVALSETPAGLGFGEAAVKMSSLFRLKPQASDGTYVAHLTVTLTLEFPRPFSRR
jgi:protein TonB